MPTLRELGYTEAVYTSPYGIGAPAHTEAAIVRKLHDAFRAALFDPLHVQELAKYDQEPEYMGTADYARARALAQLGVVFQQPALDLNLSVRASLRLHADLHGLPASVSRPRIEELLERFGLAEAAGRPARELSGGNRRKVELLRARAERGIGVLWATHLVDEAERAQRVIVLHQGRVRWDGPAQGLCEQQGQGTLEEAFLQLTGGQRHEA